MTGVVDFIVPNSEGFVCVDSSVYRDKAFWDRASSHGFKVAVIEYPMMYPAYPINGVILSSWRSICSYPNSLIAELEKVLGHPYMNLGVKHAGDDAESTLDFALRVMEEKNKASEHLLGLKDWSLFVDVTVQTDWVLHKTWHLIDEKHPLHSAFRDPYVEMLFREFWVSLDEHIREIAEGFDVTIIVSDHGFGPAWGFFNAAAWLRRIGIEKNVRTLMAPKVPYPCGLLYVDDDACIRILLDKFKKMGDNNSSDSRIISWELQDLYQGEKKHLLPHIAFCVNNWITPVIWDPESTTVIGEGVYREQTGTHRPVGVIIVRANSPKTASSLTRAGDITKVANKLLSILFENK